MPTRETIEDRRRSSSSLPPAPPPLPERDVRRKRPPALSFLLRMETLRKATRVISLLALDFPTWAAGVCPLCAAGGQPEKPGSRG